MTDNDGEDQPLELSIKFGMEIYSSRRIIHEMLSKLLRTMEMRIYW